MAHVSDGGFAQDLLCWYRANRRSLPWRERQDDAYAIWISEIMLQQTTVSAVTLFYQRWMHRFPTVESLAEAPIDDVLKHWEGLGYYARARNLYKTAKIVVAEHTGRFPDTVAGLIALPGIGRYTAGAIASIAYNQDAPILDVNVARVLCRVHAIGGDPRDSSMTQKQLWRIAEDSIPTGEAREYNQALMELGALICSPNAPNCPVCPVARHCAAQREGDPEKYPEFSRVKTWLDVRHCAALIQEDGKILIVRRPMDGLWGGLWELPRAVLREGETDVECASRALRETVGVDACGLQEFGTHKHVVTNKRVALVGFAGQRATDRPLIASGVMDFAWVVPASLRDYAIASPQQALLKLWHKRRAQPSLEF